MPLAGPGTFDSFFGDGLDGDAFFTSVGGGILPSDHFCGTVTINGPVGLEASGNRLFCRRLLLDSSQLTNPSKGALHCNGGDGNGVLAGLGAQSGFFGGGGAGGIGGKAATGAPGTDAGNGALPPGTSLGGTGGDGGLGLSGANGKGATPVLLAAPFRRVSFFTALTGMFVTPTGLAVPAGGAGGGGGGRLDGANPSDGGGGGGGAGIVFVCARELILTGDNPHFSARGGDGGASGGGIGTGGGGGGSGGAIILVCGRIIGKLVTNVAGGAGGAGPNPGTPGQPGNVFVYQL